MADTLDLVPEYVRIRSVAGATLAFSDELRDETGALIATAGSALETAIFGRYGAAPPVTAFASSSPSPGVISLALTSAETLALAGSWGFSVWLVQGLTRTCVLRGDLELTGP